MNTLAVIPDSSLFSTAFEKQVFQKLNDNVPLDTIDLFSALNYKAPLNNGRVSKYIIEIREKVRNYPVNRKLRTIYNDIHAEFLIKYTEEAYFNDIFTNGNYNCVTASALYALVLTELDIPFQIKETPDHVYLIADPHNTAFLIESTLPGEKLIQYDDRIKSQYVDFLHNNKLISENEFRNLSKAEIFEKHYLSDKTISLKQLAGLQYYNKGAFLYHNEKFGEARINFEKASLLNNHEMISYMLNNTLIKLLDMENQSKVYNGQMLAKYVNINDSNSLGQKFAEEYFGMVSSELIINRPQLNAYHEYFKDFSANLVHTEVSEIKRIYYFFLGYHHAVNYEYPQALDNLGKAYELNNENVLTRQLVIECLMKYLANELELPWTNDSLNYYIAKFPFLRNDKNIISILGGSYFRSIARSLYDDDYKSAYRLLGKFEVYLKEYPVQTTEMDVWAGIYQQFAYYHMRMREYDKAEQVLRKGLRLFPDTEFLKDQLRNVMSIRGGSYEFPELMDDSNPLKKYLLAIAIAKDNLITTNQYAAQLKQNWKGLSGNEEVTLNAMENNNVSFSNSRGTFSGTWNYNPDRCVLSLTLEPKKNKVCLVITELLPGQLKGIMYYEDDYKNSADMDLKPLLVPHNP